MANESSDTIEDACSADDVDENDVINITNHCLFPVLKVLLLQCETSMQTLDQTSDAELRSKIAKEMKTKCITLSSDSELDSLMVLAVQVLRIHLMELDKTKELTTDFCVRYTETIRQKMTPENLLGYEDRECSFENDSEQVATIQAPDGSLVALHMSGPAKAAVPAVKIDRVQVNEHWSLLQSQNGLLLTQESSNNGGGSISSDGGSMSDLEGEDVSSFSGGAVDACSNTKKSSLPKSATHVLRTWLFQHIVHPYPTEEEKMALAQDTNLSLIQVNNWFINARRRILQPCFNQFNKDLKKPQRANVSHAAHKNWPNDLLLKHVEVSVPAHNGLPSTAHNPFQNNNMGVESSDAVNGQHLLSDSGMGHLESASCSLVSNTSAA